MNIGLLGSGGHANEVESYWVDGEVLFRAVSKKYLDGSNPKLLDIAQPGEHKNIPVIGAVGAPALRRQMVEEWSGDKYATIISDDAYVDKNAMIGEGTVVAPGSVITTNVKIGKHGIINVGATISHDSTIGNYVTISPGVHLGGRGTIGDGVFIGGGAVVSNNVKIANGVVVGAGAVVIEDVTEENAVVVGVPAKIIKRNDDWLFEI